MSTSTSAASSRVYGPSHWDQLNHVLGEWWQHLRSRHELESLDESMLRDIGLSRGEAGFEASKHIFWTPAKDRAQIAQVSTLHQRLLAEPRGGRGLELLNLRGDN
jgi:uncharacterized protein YjiS (DUF1127 family)